MLCARVSKSSHGNSAICSCSTPSRTQLTRAQRESPRARHFRLTHGGFMRDTGIMQASPATSSLSNALIFVLIVSTNLSCTIRLKIAPPSPELHYSTILNSSIATSQTRVSLPSPKFLLKSTCEVPVSAFSKLINMPAFTYHNLLNSHP